MNAQEIINKLDDNELDISRYDFAEGALDEDIFGKTEVVHEEGGREGGGEYVERVVHFVDHNVYIKLEGYYSSYNGTEYDDSDYEEVRPKQVEVTIYK